MQFYIAIITRAFATGVYRNECGERLDLDNWCVRARVDLLHTNSFIGFKSLFGIFPYDITMLRGSTGRSAIAIIEVKLYELSLVKFS